MRIFIQIKNFIKNILIIYGIKKSRSGKYFVSRISPCSPWVYVSYLPDILCGTIEELNHQNRKEQIAMVEVFNELGYNVFVEAYDSKPCLPNINVKLVLGLEPNFEIACEKYSNAKHVYYATGAYYKHQNSQIIKMTNWVNKKYNSKIPYRRLVEPHNSSEIADYILQIGSNFTKLTYPIELQNKIHFIHQSSLVYNSSNDFASVPSNEFLFIASEGNILRGVPLLFEFFSQHDNLILHWVGPVENDVLEMLANSITPNIICHGRMDVNSNDFINLCNKTNYIIYPSGSEGVPGSVLTAMSYGQIPLVTQWASFDEIEQYGYLMRDWSIESIERAVEWALSLTSDDILARKYRVKDYVSTYTLENYKKEFEQFIIKIMK